MECISRLVKFTSVDRHFFVLPRVIRSTCYFIRFVLKILLPSRYLRLVDTGSCILKCHVASFPVLDVKDGSELPRLIYDILCGQAALAFVGSIKKGRRETLRYFVKETEGFDM